ncbi:hypothetical protein QO010_000758 [Caulobacter ginsengisoli]|uniref:Uncharacterized protein n=1 Tax=Caulobacter ginsengisoli TaxID=400775 RepID=A0ABU0ILX4_9CAUL|nr:hypothetical protein [Caulobacter ginsengisoli]MDQ0463010.1 hypothetical protein [Caulobacter ginsengisoli]
MTRHLDVAGKSGVVYRYRPLSEDMPVTLAGANYLILEGQGENVTIARVGESDCLYRDVDEVREQAGRRRGRVSLFVRLNVSGEARRQEQADILAAQERAEAENRVERPVRPAPKRKPAGRGKAPLDS